MFCNKCGARLPENSVYCTQCGACLFINTTQPQNGASIKLENEPVVNDAPVFSIEENQYNNAYNPTPVEETPNTKKLRGGMLAWSIINMTLEYIGSTFIAALISPIPFINTPFGILGLLFTILAATRKTAAKEEKLSKRARLFNILGSAAAAIFLIVFIAFLIISLFSGLLEGGDSVNGGGEFY